MIRIQLPSEHREALEKARRIRTSNLAERCFAILLSNREAPGSHGNQPATRLSRPLSARAEIIVRKDWGR